MPVKLPTSASQIIFRPLLLRPRPVQSFRGALAQARTYAMPGALSIREHIMNVNNRPLVQHGTDPMTGWYRTGFCETDESDYGNHTIAGVVSEEFLNFSARKGNNLRSAGLADGCRWCLCVSRWKEALDAFSRGEVSRSTVPLVDLEATHSRALSSGVTLDQLRQFSTRAEDRGE
ncbi:hypothetical protein TWF694_009336 [Orbilia ellipsospora]|uniref:Uncharacterized protein n=1 Tax=Orbilia ellipsospora TaxID=2528407 RepID=A0AAV9XEK6_9PEZI